MPEIRKAASLHEKTVQAVAAGEIEPRRSRRTPPGAPRAVDTHGFKTDPRVLEAAKRVLREGRSHGYSRIEFVAQDVAIVR